MSEWSDAQSYAARAAVDVADLPRRSGVVRPEPCSCSCSLSSSVVGECGWLGWSWWPRIICVE
jgi:hypothetical protein